MGDPLLRKHVAHRHFQSVDWWIDIVAVGVRQGEPVFDLVETRRLGAASDPLTAMQTRVLAEKLPWSEAHRRLTDRAHRVSRDAGVEDEAPPEFTDGGRLIVRAK